MSGPTDVDRAKAAEPLTALEWLRVTHADTLSGRRIEEAIAAERAAAVADLRAAEAVHPLPVEWRAAPEDLVTAPDARQNDELRGVLIEGLRSTSRLRLDEVRGYFDPNEIADAILPVVTDWAEKQARARAAVELRQAAETWRAFAQPPSDGDPDISRWLSARAAALAADDQTDPA